MKNLKIKFNVTNLSGLFLIIVAVFFILLLEAASAGLRWYAIPAVLIGIGWLFSSAYKESR